MTSHGSCLMVGEGRGGRCRSRLVDRSALRLGLMALAEPAIRSSFLIANFVCARRQTDIDWSKCPWVGNIWNENPPGKHKLSASYVSGMHCGKKWGEDRVRKGVGKKKTKALFLLFFMSVFINISGFVQSNNFPFFSLSCCVAVIISLPFHTELCVGGCLFIIYLFFKCTCWWVYRGALSLWHGALAWKHSTPKWDIWDFYK